MTVKGNCVLSVPFVYTVIMDNNRHDPRVRMMCHGEDYDDKINLGQPNASETFLPLDHWKPEMMCKVKQTPGIHSLFLSLLRCSRVGHEEMSMDAFSTPDIHLLGMHCRHYLIVHPERVPKYNTNCLWQSHPLYQGYSKLFPCSQHLRMRIF